MSDTTRRDRWGRYLVVPPKGGKPVGYTRVTTIAKALDDGAGLLAWGACATVVGAHRMRGLQARWQALLATSPDPWYDSPESKAEAKRLVDECKIAGGSADRADMGTALHSIIETHLKGGDMPLLDDTTRADVEAFNTAVTNAGIRFDIDMLEQMVVLDGLKIAGRADQLVVHVPGYDLPLIGDLKTGASLDFSMPSIAIQLSAYANADNRYLQGADPADDIRLPMPEVSRTHAVVFHLPAGEARCTIHIVDIAAGWAALQTAVQVRAWRTRRDLAHVLPPAPAVEVDADTVEHSSPVSADSLATQKQRVYSLDAPSEGDQADPASVDTLKHHYDALTAEHRRWIGELFSQAQAGHCGFSLATVRTVRRYELMRGLIRLAKNDICADDVIHQLAADTIADYPHLDRLPLGHILGRANHLEAAQFAQLADQLVDGTISILVNTDGTMRLQAA